jgi:altronate dehydratase
MAAEDVSGSVLVPIARLRELEALEEKIKTTRKERLMLLREREKKDPEPHKKKVLENYHKNKEAINAQRREAYRLKKAAAAAAATVADATVTASAAASPAESPGEVLSADPEN